MICSDDLSYAIIKCVSFSSRLRMAIGRSLSTKATMRRSDEKIYAKNAKSNEEQQQGTREQHVSMCKQNVGSEGSRHKIQGEVGSDGYDDANEDQTSHVV